MATKPNLSDFVGESKQIVEAGVSNAPVKDVLWNAQEVQTETAQIIDPGVGKENILRHFFFKSMPLPKGVPKPDKHQIVSHYKKMIEMSLWGDGLIIREDKPLEVLTVQKAKKVSPSLYRKMKIEGSDFCILVLAQPRFGQNVVDHIHRAQ